QSLADGVRDQKADRDPRELRVREPKLLTDHRPEPRDREPIDEVDERREENEADDPPAQAGHAGSQSFRAHCTSGASMPSAANMARALTRVSSYSAWGSESATMPPPTGMWTRPSRTIMVRMAMLNSMLPSLSSQPM